MVFRGFGYQVFHFYREDLMFVRKVKANGCFYKYDTNVTNKLADNQLGVHQKVWEIHAASWTISGSFTNVIGLKSG